MNHTVLNFYSLFMNVKRFVNRKKAGDIDLDKGLPPFLYENIKPFVKSRYKNLWNEYANYFFTYRELKQCILYRYLFDDNVSIINITTDDVKEVRNLLSEKQFEIDKEILKEINKRTGYKTIKKFFQFSPEGENVIYRLTIKKTISPMVYIKFVDEIEENDQNENYKKFIKIIKKLKQTLNTEN